MSLAQDRTETGHDAGRGRRGWYATGGVLGAILASACCIGPLVLLTLGISGAWIGSLTALAPYKPIFAVIALGFIAAGFRQVYFRKNRPRVTAGLNGRPNLGCRRCLLVKMDQHGRPPSRSSLRTDLAMNKADLRGEM